MSSYYENYSTNLGAITLNKAKKRINKNLMKSYDPEKTIAKKELKKNIDEAKRAFQDVDVSKEYNSLISNGIQGNSLMDELEGLTSIRQISVDTQYTSQIFGIVSRLSVIFTNMYNTVKSLLPTFNNLTPSEVNELTNIFNMLNQSMEKVIDNLMTMRVRDTASQASKGVSHRVWNELKRVINILNADLDTSLFDTLVDQYNYKTPTNVAINSIRQNVKQIREQFTNANFTKENLAPEDQHTESEGSTVSSTGIYPEDDSEDEEEEEDEEVAGVQLRRSPRRNTFQGLYGEGIHRQGGVLGLPRTSDLTLIGGSMAYPFMYANRTVGNRGRVWGI
jgi:hypothetical protein